MAYNKVYEYLVEAPDDVIGLLAYAIYKQEKRNWIVQEKQSNSEHSDIRLAGYVAGQLLEGSRSRYRSEAENLLAVYSLKTIEREKPSIVQAAVTEEMRSIARHVRESGVWYKQLGTGIVAAAVYTLILILFALCLRYAGIDLESIFQNIAA
jgi:hypothetical protein